MTLPSDTADLIRDGLVVVTAPWCHHCRAMRDDLDEIAALHPAGFQEIDAGSQPDVASALAVRGTPTALVIRNGAVVERHAGRIGRADLERLVAAGAAGRVRLGSTMRDAVIRTATGVVLAGAAVATGEPVLAGFGAVSLLWAVLGYRSARR